jgi:DNA topoisomerase VI subunit B
MNAMTNQETDTALILENELKRRVEQVVRGIAADIVRKEMREEFAKQKEAMLMEVSITVGKHLRLIENEVKQESPISKVLEPELIERQSSVQRPLWEIEQALEKSFNKI